MKKTQTFNLFEEVKKGQKHPKKTKKLFISSLPLIQKMLQNKKAKKKLPKKETIFIQNKNLELDRKYQIYTKTYVKSGYKIKQIVEKNNNISYESENSIPNLMPENLMKFSSYKNTIIIDADGNNNLNDEQRNLISNYLLKSKNIKIKINPNYPEKICNKGSKKSKTTNNKNGFEMKNEISISKLLKSPRKSKTLCSEQNKKFLENFKDNIDEKIKNILYKNLLHSKEQSAIFADADIPNEIKENNEYGSFLDSSTEDDEFSKGLIENLKLL